MPLVRLPRDPASADLVARRGEGVVEPPADALRSAPPQRELDAFERASGGSDADPVELPLGKRFETVPEVLIARARCRHRPPIYICADRFERQRRSGGHDPVVSGRPLARLLPG